MAAAPRRSRKKTSLYNCFTTEAVPPVVPPAGSSCTNVEVARNPKTQGVDTVAHGVAGAAGGAIGGVLVAALINMDVGKIVQRPPDHNAEFVRTILAAAAHAAPLPQAPAASAASPD